MNKKMSFFKMPQPDLIPETTKDKRLASNGKTHNVTYPVSYRYNGGIIIGDKWFNGYKIPQPKIPKGWKLVNIGCGLQLNSRPPFAINVLQPINNP
jgi:hypothetical protein